MTTVLIHDLNQLASEAKSMDADWLDGLPNKHVAERIQKLQAGLVEAAAALKLIDEWKQQWVREDFEHVYLDAEEDWELRAPVNALLDVFVEFSKMDEKKEQEFLQS